MRELQKDRDARGARDLGSNTPNLRLLTHGTKDLLQPWQVCPRFEIHQEHHQTKHTEAFQTLLGFILQKTKHFTSIHTVVQVTCGSCQSNPTHCRDPSQDLAPITTSSFSLGVPEMVLTPIPTSGGLTSAWLKPDLSPGLRLNEEGKN